MRIKVPLVLLILLPTLAQAEPQASVADRIAPFISPQTLIICRLDLARLKLADLQKQIGNDPRASAAIQPLLQGIDALKAAGAREIYWTYNLSQAPDAIGIVPLEPGASADKIGSILLTTFLIPTPSYRGVEKVQILNNAVCVASEGALATLTKQLAPAPRPEFAAALVAAKNAPVTALFIPNPDTRKVLTQMLPTFPPQLGGQSTAPLSRVQWTTLAIDFAPALHGSVHFQTDTSESAKSLQESLSTALAAAKKNMPAAYQQNISIQQTDKAVVLTLETDTLQQFLPLVLATQRKATHVQSVSNMKQIVLACTLYANDHQDIWPADLKIVAKQYSLKDQAFINPLDPTRKDPYVYLEPKTKRRVTPPTDIILYEAHEDTAIDVAAGFADGHIELLSKAEFDQELKARRAGRQEKTP